MSVPSIVTVPSNKGKKTIILFFLADRSAYQGRIDRVNDLLQSSSNNFLFFSPRSGSTRKHNIATASIHRRWENLDLDHFCFFLRQRGIERIFLISSSLLRSSASWVINRWRERDAPNRPPFLCLPFSLFVRMEIRHNAECSRAALLRSFLSLGPLCWRRCRFRAYITSLIDRRGLVLRRSRRFSALANKAMIGEPCFSLFPEQTLSA